MNVNKPIEEITMSDDRAMMNGVDDGGREREARNAAIEEALKKRIIEIADEYHLIAEEQWVRAIDLQPESEDANYEFRRLIRAALQFYIRAFLQLSMVESDDEQELEELSEIASEIEPQLCDLIEKNHATSVLDDESDAHLSRVFALAEALRSMLLQLSNQLAASLATRFAGRSGA